MKIQKSLRAATLAFLVFLAWLPFSVASAENRVGTNIESRVLLGFAANSDAVQELFPGGWASIAFPSGPLAGANLLVAMIDTELSIDGDGVSVEPPTRRTVTFVGLGKQDGDGAVRMFVLSTFTTAPELDPFGNAAAASIARVSSRSGATNGPRLSEDLWKMLPEGGGRIVLNLEYESGKRSWSSGEARPFSAVKTGFYEIYRYEQLVDVVMSKALGKPMADTLEFSSTLLEFADIFDGNHEVVAVLDVPVYVREVYLPD